MILRTILSIAMLVPALPTEADCGECPFTSVEECRVWLDACCGAGNDVETICGFACIETTGDENEACAGVSCTEGDRSECSSNESCCSAEPYEPGVAGCESLCSSEDPPIGEAAEPSASDDEPVCLWCVCCPMGRPRPPEPQSAPITQRASPEKEKASNDSGSRRVEPPAMSTLLLAFARLNHFVPPDSRQAMLCVWRN
ncbi:MAG TPA: hypothetical protein VJZ71_15295 [Phycisphaerae bacterium]|nr:hypothetical protein [Phycisphaerae bacterium]